MKFVILDHAPPEHATSTAVRTLDRHFDLLFEVEGMDSLVTYAMKDVPHEVGSQVEIISLANHRSTYLTYEGPISNNRGVVMQHAKGVWTGELTTAAVLSFDDDSNHFAGEAWTIKIDMAKNQLSRIV